MGLVTRSDNSNNELDLCESIIYGMFLGAYHTIWLQNFVRNLGVVDSIDRPIVIYFDNSTYGLNTIEYTPTHNMMADPLTKGLPFGIFDEHAFRIKLWIDTVVGQ